MFSFFEESAKVKSVEQENISKLCIKLNQAYADQEKLLQELVIVEDNIRLLQEMIYHQSRRLSRK